MEIRENLRRVQGDIAAALARSGRVGQTVRLVAVTKTVGLREMNELLQAGQTVFGENRPQTFRDKSRSFPAATPIRWHFIGNLQTNKIKYVYPTAELVHSIDRVELLETFPDWAGKTGRICPCLLEVHISPEDSKHGFSPDEVLAVLETYRARPGLEIRGLMGMAPFVSDESKIRASFRLLAGLFEESKRLAGPSYTPLELSMGMTDDFPLAIEEGATIVRIGRALFT